MNIYSYPTQLFKWSKENSSEFSIVVMRTMMALLWFYEGFSKVLNRNSNMYDDYNGFLGQLNWAASTHPYHWFSQIIENYMIANWEMLVIFIIVIELSIGFSLLFGFLTRFSSLLACFMAINLWFLTLGWDEWVWTYPLIFIPHFVLFFSHSGKNMGIDYYLANLDNKVLNKLI